MARTTTLISVALCLAVLAGHAHQAQAARSLKESLKAEAGRALKQVGDAFTRWGTGAYVDDGSRTAYSQYSRVSGYAEYGNPYGYYGNSVAADYFGNSYPSRAELALYRGAYPSSSYLSTRASNRVARYASSTPWELY